MKATFKCVVLAQFFINSISFGYHEVTDLKKHRMNIGGRLSFPVEIDRFNHFYWIIDAGPYLGFFLADNLELRGNLDVNAKYELAQPSIVKTPVFWNTSLQTIYYFNASKYWKPYIGVGIGVGLMDLNIYSLNGIIDIPIGILFSINNDFAFDVGMPIHVHMSMKSFREKVKMFPGAFSLRYFFN